MKFLCLPYGEEKDWQALSKDDQDELMGHDEVLRRRGDRVESVGFAGLGRAPATTDGPLDEKRLPLAGFASSKPATWKKPQLTTNTPCARAQGAVEL